MQTPANGTILKIRTTVAIFSLALLTLLATGGGDARALAQGTKAGTWTKLGSFPAGTWSAALDPSSGGALYSLGPEGIARSTDAGATWTLCNRGASMMRLVGPPSGQQGRALLYATTPTGLRQSDDGCANWKDVPSTGILPTSAHVRWLAAYPSNRQVLYAGMDGLGGFYRSSDGGANWQPASQGLPPGAWITAFAADPHAPEKVTVGVRYVLRSHPPAYVFRSSDGGVTWRSSSLGMGLLPNNSGEVVGLGWSGDTLFAATSNDGLFASTDGGVTWTSATLPRRTAAPVPPPVMGQTGNQPLPMPLNAFGASLEGALLISTPEGAFQSLDGGRTWQSLAPDGGNPGRSPFLALDPNSGQAVLAGSGGAWNYKLASGVVSLPPALPSATTQAQPTPPPPPPTAIERTSTPTRVPPTPTPTRTPTATPSPTPTIPVIKGPLPSDKAKPLDPAISTYFPETGHNVKQGFRDYWNSHGGLGFLGYPLTEEFVENGVTVQYFERGRLEYRNGKVGLGLVGVESTKGQFFQTVRFFPSTDTDVYFGPTQHSVSGPFLQYWRDVGGLDTLGYPLSESFDEPDGSEYQWFERGRLEWHPDLPQGKRIVLGRVGYELLYRRGWIRP